ncbi:site-specific tyrosine recombinase [Candidatus Scalindua japonica]|uniref:Site-specific tyrosine recombinase n=1 Tax=Candidatus Scalindua japonica TaxID=1284222 RepID=A0A286TWW3_9BACT|nr:site-specific integrase [Candidatus Scalindua japonica]GAX60379.1 site-specific tyrosine recombinase [Candidatus Scalindua japonica]
MFKRSDIWWTCISHNGRKVQRSLETSDKKLAQAIEAKIRTEIVEGKYYERLTGQRKTFKDMMDRFMKDYAPTVSMNTQEGYKYYLKNLNRFFGNPGLMSITPKIVTKYKLYRRDNGASPSTVNRELYMLSKAFNLAVKEWEWLKDNPVSRVQKERENNEVDRWLTEDEERRLLGNSPDWLREIIVFALNTGLRQDELLSLEWSRVNLLRKTILIQKTKNNKPNTLPLNSIALNVLMKKHESKVRSIKNDLVFISKSGSKICKRNLIRAFAQALEKAEIKDFTFHCLRHTFATRLAQNGVDIYKIAKLLNHKDLKNTQRYSHHCPESLMVGVQILEKFDYNFTTMAQKGG